MARINVEEKWWSDPRRTKLGQLLGNPYFTETVVVHSWRLAQEYWEKGELIPGHIFITLHGAYELLEANLACLHENSDPESSKTPTPIQHIASTDPTGVQRLLTHSNIIQEASIYMRGSRELLSWGIDKRQKRIAAGKKSAERPRDSRGRLLKKSTESQQITSTSPTKSNIVQVSGSGSGSGSGSSSRSRSKKNNMGVHESYTAEYDELWKLYPKGDKALAYQVYKTLGLALDEHADLKMAIQNYQRQKPDLQYRKDFERFLKVDWREFINPIKQPNAVHPKTQERLNSFDQWKAEVEARESGGTHESEN